MMSRLQTLLTDLREGQRYRGDCPFCFRSNTFTATKQNGRVLYNCFSASCGKRGGTYEGYSVEELKQPTIVKRKSQELFSIPEHFIDDIPETAIRWLERCNCMEAIQDKRAVVKWDVRTNRLVFLNIQNGVCYDAIGRLMDGSIHHGNPKWYRFGNSNIPYTVRCEGVEGYKNRSLIVEDCGSACSGSRLLDSVGLLGTILTTEAIKELMKYEEVFIALDPDAKLKAMDMYTTLSQFVKCKIVFPTDDPKYLTIQELEQCLK